MKGKTTLSALSSLLIGPLPSPFRALSPSSPSHGTRHSRSQHTQTHSESNLSLCHFVLKSITTRKVQFKIQETNTTMFGGGNSGSRGGIGGAGGGGEREVHKRSGSSYTQHQHQMNMNMLLPPPSFQQHLFSPTVPIAGSGGGGEDDDFPRRDERVVQWGDQETREFIAIRGELEAEFTVTKRNKTLWEVVSGKMKDLGYRRTPDQCKCKWKNLINRYKGKESADQDNGHQFPYYDDLHAVFSAKANQLQQLVHEADAGSMQLQKRARRVYGDESSEEISEDVEDDNESDEGIIAHGSFAQQKKVEKDKRPRTAASAKSPRQPITRNPSNNGCALASIQEMLQNFLQQQQRIEMQWKESMEKSARERERFEQEWRQAMEKLQKERIMQEQAWRERDEERRVREESRAERRDALLTTLLKKLTQEN